ncbi:type II toxin-antitoxin system VapC family toxin [Rubrimonas sp.]|uniref:type II toxin-antitoxin system VapC family toxin n=1 Tax=Rubrimonas sp. TaxID=2036015 RepID=UPI002FDE8BD7
MRLLLDTCVVSELRRTDGEPRVAAAVDALAADAVYLSVITLGELACGVARMADGARKAALGAWLAGLERDYADRILDIDAETARLWGLMTARAQAVGRTVGAADGLIAASARRHGLTVMTRNIRDFAPTGVDVVNPWPEP